MVDLLKFPRSSECVTGDGVTQIVVKAVPVREGHNLEMIFPITPEIQNYKAAPSRYLGHLIGHEADGSLFAHLKKLGEGSNNLLAQHKHTYVEEVNRIPARKIETF